MLSVPLHSSTYFFLLSRMTSQTTLPSILCNSSVSPGSDHTRHPSSSFSFGVIAKLPIGANNVELNIMSMAPPSEEQFMRSSCFEHLISVLHDHHDSFTIPELTAALCHALPINTSTASETAHQLCAPINSAPFLIDNLNFCGFCNHHGNEIQISKTFLINCPEKHLICLLWVYYWSCNHTCPPFNFAFCLHLPQTTKKLPSSSATPPTNTSTATNTTSTTTSTSTPSTPQPHRRTSTSSNSSNDEADTNPHSSVSFESILQQLNNPNSSTPLDTTSLKQQLHSLQSLYATTQSTTSPPSPPPIHNTTTTTTPPPTQPTTTFNPLLSPKMSSFLGSSVPSLNLLTTYHGPLDFVDVQTTFTSTFGSAPPLLHINHHSLTSAGSPIKNPNLVPQILNDFFNWCKYDIFVCICRDNYVGYGYVPDNSQAMQEICKKINALSMHYTLGTIIKTCHPNNLYMKYLPLASSLPKNSTSWSIVLCTTYYNSLSEPLQNKMREKKFIMSPLHTLSDKESQLCALCTV